MNFCLSDLVPPLRWSDTSTITLLTGQPGLPDAWWRSLPMPRVLAAIGPEALGELLTEIAIEHWPAAAVGDVLPALHMLDPDEADEPYVAIALDRAGSWPGLLALTARELMDQPFVQARPVLTALFSAALVRLSPVPGISPVPSAGDVDQPAAERLAAHPELAEEQPAAQAGPAAVGERSGLGSTPGESGDAAPLPEMAPADGDIAQEHPEAAQAHPEPASGRGESDEIDPELAGPVPGLSPIGGAADDAGDQPEIAVAEGQFAAQAAPAEEHLAAHPEFAAAEEQSRVGPAQGESGDAAHLPEIAQADDDIAREHPAAHPEAAQARPAADPELAQADPAADPELVQAGPAADSGFAEVQPAHHEPGEEQPAPHRELADEQPVGQPERGESGRDDVSVAGVSAADDGASDDERSADDGASGDERSADGSGDTADDERPVEEDEGEPVGEDEGSAADGTDLPQLIEAAFAHLDDKSWAVAQNRVFTDEPSAVDQLAKLFAVPPAEIAATEDRLRGMLGEWLASDEAAPYRAHLEELREKIGPAAPKERLIEAADWHGREIKALEVPAWQFVLATLPDRPLPQRPAPPSAFSAPYGPPPEPQASPFSPPPEQPPAFSPSPEPPPAFSPPPPVGLPPGFVPPDPVPSQFQAFAPAVPVQGEQNGGDQSGEQPGKPYQPLKDVSQTRRCFRQPDGRWWLRVDVTAEQLGGGECALPTGFAAYLGLSPGESKTVRSAAGELTMVWHGRPVLESIDRLLADVGAKEGGHLFLTLSDEGVLRARHLPVAAPGAEKITKALRLVGYTAPGGTRDQAARVIATRIGMTGPVNLPDLLTRLRERGDRDLLQLLD